MDGGSLSFTEYPLVLKLELPVQLDKSHGNITPPRQLCCIHLHIQGTVVSIGSFSDERIVKQF